jgi:hypothetical protein
MIQSSFWKKKALQTALAGCIGFVLLTLVAMLAYPGGTVTDHSTQGYRFSENFFSDLGRILARNGQSNLPSMAMFVLGLSGAAAALGIFFISYAQYFSQPIYLRILAWLGSATGVASAICFLGIAWTPTDLNRFLHVQFVLWAFRLFLVAVIFYIPTLLLGSQLPRQQAIVLLVFAGLLAAYLVLLTSGPRADSPDGLLIQAVGQKIIVYASIVSIGLLAWWTQKIHPHRV